MVFRRILGHIANHLAGVRHVPVAPAIVRQRIENVVLERVGRVDAPLDYLGNVVLAAPDTKLAGLTRPVLLSDATYAQADDREGSSL